MSAVLLLTQNTLPKQVNQEKGVDRFRVAKSISSPKTAWAAFYLRRKRLKDETPMNKQLLKEAAVKAR